MLQRGIEAPDMDVTWVSSISWYFAALFVRSSLRLLECSRSMLSA